MRLFKVLIVLWAFMALNHDVTGSAVIDTVSDYAELRIYDGLSDTIYIDNPRTKGIFVKYLSSDCPQDFGTIIRSNNGLCWKRQFTFYEPRFWEMEGPSPEVFVIKVLKDVDAVNSAAIAAYQAGGGTVLIDTLYEIDTPVYLYEGVSYLGADTTCGFKRFDTHFSVLVSDAEKGATSLHLENTSGFRSYQMFSVLNGRGYDMNSGAYFYNVGVVSDSIIGISGIPLQREMKKGDTVAVVFPMMRPRFSVRKDITLENLKFDGNWANNPFTNDWRLNTTLNINGGENLVIRNCTFNNTPSENIFVCGGIIENCRGNNFGGSAIHFSCPMDHPENTLIQYNKFSNLNQIKDSIIIHSEAALTFSVFVRRFTIRYNHVKGSSKFALGPIIYDAYYDTITDNFFEDIDKLASMPFGPARQDSFIIFNNKFLNDAVDTTIYEDCFSDTPAVNSEVSCAGGSSFDNPLEIGDIVKVCFDSLKLQASRINFLKGIYPIYDSTYFSLTGGYYKGTMNINHHSWQFLNSSTTPDMRAGLFFNNGYSTNIDTFGNWGFESCTTTGCGNFCFEFEVKSLPDSLSMVDCPINGLEVLFDGEMESWHLPPGCNNKTFLCEVEGCQADGPYLKGKSISKTESVTSESFITIVPNPARDFLKLHTKSGLSEETDLEIFDIYGKKWLSGRFNTSDQIDISILPQGVYTILIADDNKYHISKLMKL